MSPLDLFALVGMVSVPAVVGLATALVKANKELEIWRGIARGNLDRGAPERSAVARDADRDRLEQSVEAIALEVERITEGQRFMAKLLAERSGLGRASDERPQIPGPAPRSITPH
jgi:hypothetical protein